MSHWKEIIILILIARLFEGDSLSVSLFGGVRHLPHEEGVPLPYRVLEFVLELHGRLLQERRRDIIPMTRGELTLVQLPVRQRVYLSLNSWHVLGYVVPNHAVPYSWLAALLHNALLLRDVLDYLGCFRVAEGILEEGEVILQGFDLRLKNDGIGVPDGLVDGLFC